MRISSNSSSAWTVEEDRRLLELEKSGRSRAAISAALRRTVGAINTRLTILRKLQNHPASPARSTVWIYGQGKSLMVFATKEAAQDWFKDNDPEGVAFEYPVEA